MSARDFRKKYKTEPVTTLRCFMRYNARVGFIWDITPGCYMRGNKVNRTLKLRPQRGSTNTTVHRKFQPSIIIRLFDLTMPILARNRLDLKKIDFDQIYDPFHAVGNCGLTPPRPLQKRLNKNHHKVSLIGDKSPFPPISSACIFYFPTSIIGVWTTASASSTGSTRKSIPPSSPGTLTCVR